MAVRCVLVFAAVAALAAAGCFGPRQAGPTARGAEGIVVRDVAPIFRGMIGSETLVRGDSPRLITGVGLVVGLRGTGSGDVPAGVRIRLEERMARLGVGSAGGGALSDITPAALINSPDTAVVLVQGVVAPCLPEDTPFDVRVSAWPNSATTSLQGGRLYTTELRAGISRPDEPDTPALAEARGDIFINPFSDDGTLTPPTSGRVLSGGRIVNRRPLQLVLDNPSHARAREIVEAINSRFPKDGRFPTAIGRNDEIVELNPPAAFRDDLDGFVRLVRFLRVDRGNVGDWARRYTQAMVEEPRVAEDLSWAMRALGPAAVPLIRPLYEHPDVAPRLAAIQAGAFLGDPTVRPHIESLVESGPLAFRANAIELFDTLGTDPRINQFLRAKLSDPDPGIRIAAYESMLARADPLILAPDVSDDFDLHVLPSERPTIYVTQQDEATIVLLGQPLDLEPDAFTAIWEGEFLLTGEPSDARVQMLYDQPEIDRLVRLSTSRDLVDIVGALARRPSTEAFELGFDMNYSRTVRVLAELIDSGSLIADFFPEDDRLRLALLQARDRAPTRRPELLGDSVEDRAALDQPPSDAEIAAQAEAADARSRSVRDRLIRFARPEEDGDR